MTKNPYDGANDEEVIRATGDILTLLVKDSSIMPSIITLLPSVESVQTAHDFHRGLFNDVLGGNREKEGDLQEARSQVKKQLALLRGLAVLAGSQDPSIPQRLGLVQHAPPTKRVSAHLTSVQNFRIVYDGRKMVARASAVKGAKSYEVWCCEGDPLTESNWRHVTSTGRVNRIELTGLTPGKLYYFRIRTISSTGSGPWSNFISMMAI